MEGIEKICIDDVPKKVIASVRAKWRKARREGWDEDLWRPCKMCEYVDEEIGRRGEDPEDYAEEGCEICALNPDWCTGDMTRSKIAGPYCDVRESCEKSCYECTKEPDMDKWACRIDDFIEYLTRVHDAPRKRR